MSTRAVALLVVVTLSVLLGSAAAIAKPRVSIAVPSTADAGASIGVTYTATGIRASDRLVIQRQQGTAHIWRTAVRLRHSRAGSATLHSLPLGTYRVRIAAVSARRRVRAQQARRLYVFGQVAFSRLFPNGTVGVYTTSTSTFSYWLHEYDVGNSGTGTMFTVVKNTCRSAHIDFIPGADSGSENLGGMQATASVVQESLDPNAVTVPAQTLGSLDVALVPGQSWSFNTDQPAGRLLTWYVNGRASCYSMTLAS